MAKSAAARSIIEALEVGASTVIANVSHAKAIMRTHHSANTGLRFKGRRTRDGYEITRIA